MESSNYLNTSSEDDEYEELLVYVDLPELSQVPLFSTNELDIEISDLGQAEILCTINNVDFKGQNEINLGNMLFFEEIVDSEGIKSYRYHSNSINIVSCHCDNLNKLRPPNTPIDPSLITYEKSS